MKVKGKYQDISVLAELKAGKNKTIGKQRFDRIKFLLENLDAVEKDLTTISTMRADALLNESTIEDLKHNLFLCKEERDSHLEYVHELQSELDVSKSGTIGLKIITILSLMVSMALIINTLMQ